MTATVEPLYELPQFTCEHDGEQLIVGVRGVIDVVTGPLLVRCLQDHVDLGERVIVVEMHDGVIVDSTTLAGLLDWHGQFADIGGKLSIVCPGAATFRVFEIVALVEHLNVVGARADAVELLRNAA